MLSRSLQRAGLTISGLELNSAHAIWAEEGQHLVTDLKLTTELGLLREVQNMELPFVVSNDHRSRNTGCHGDNFSLNGRKSKNGIGQAAYARDQKNETAQYSEHKPVHGHLSFLCGDGSHMSSVRGLLG